MKKTNQELRMDAMLDLIQLSLYEFSRKYDEVEINDGKILKVRVKND